MELTLYPSFTYRMPSRSATIHGDRGRHDLIVKVQCGNNYYDPRHADEKSGAMSNGSDGPKQTDSEGRTFIPSRARRTCIYRTIPQGAGGNETSDGVLQVWGGA